MSDVYRVTKMQEAEMFVLANSEEEALEVAKEGGLWHDVDYLVSDTYAMKEGHLEDLSLWDLIWDGENWVEPGEISVGS